VILSHLCVTVALVEVDTINAFVIFWWRCAGVNCVASLVKWAGFFPSTVAGSLVLPTAFVTPVNNYII
jgi:hypothetical protein